MTRKVRKQKRKVKQPKYLSKEQIHKLTLNLLKALMRLPKVYKPCNQTFITEKGEQGCFPFGGLPKDILLCKYCFAKDYCAKEKAKHTIKLKEWEVINNEKGKWS